MSQIDSGHDSDSERDMKATARVLPPVSEGGTASASATASATSMAESPVSASSSSSLAAALACASSSSVGETGRIGGLRRAAGSRGHTPVASPLRGAAAVVVTADDDAGSGSGSGSGSGRQSGKSSGSRSDSSGSAGGSTSRGLKDVRVDSASDLTLLGGVSPLDEQRIQRAIEDKLLSQQAVADADSTPRQRNARATKHTFDLADPLALIRSGVRVIVADDFNRCFESNPGEAWNWNAYLWLLWAFGVVTRYCILFPFRLLCLFGGFVVFILVFAAVKLTVKDRERSYRIERKLIKFLCGVFVFSWFGVIRYHGAVPKHKPNQIYVANHTSMIDMIVLEQMDTFALVGQKHPGWVGLMQDHGLGCLGNIWFNRGDDKERHVIPNRIAKHIADPHTNRLLIFPEGVCVNNEYVVQFKKTAFELGATVCPIAIKYNKTFVDAFWNSKAQSFTMHLVSLMCSWAVVCDVWYLEPQTQRPGESAIDFSNRVKALIARTARIEDVQWDGYMKYFKPSARYVQQRQKQYAQQLLARLKPTADA